TQEDFADVGGVRAPLVLENQRAERREGFRLNLVDAFVGNGSRQRPIMNLYQRKLLEYYSNLVPVFWKELFFQEFMEPPTHRALEVRVFHNRDRSMPRPLGWLVRGYDGSQRFPLEILSQVVDTPQYQGAIVLGNVKILSLLLYPPFGGHGRCQEIGKIGVMERPCAEADSFRDFKFFTDVLNNFALRITAESKKRPHNEVVAVIGEEYVSLFQFFTIIGSSSKRGGLKARKIRRLESSRRHFHRVRDTKPLANK